jgi:hypothetical protein
LTENDLSLFRDFSSFASLALNRWIQIDPETFRGNQTDIFKISKKRIQFIGFKKNYLH